MEPGKDVVFLRSRFGFVRIAMQHGEPLSNAHRCPRSQKEPEGYLEANSLVLHEGLIVSYD